MVVTILDMAEAAAITNNQTGLVVRSGQVLPVLLAS
jgi:hypothetical protein